MMRPDAPQIRAAISLLGWENDDLAKQCGVTAQSISNIKRGSTRPQPRVLTAITRVLEFNGIEFLEGSGVRFRANTIETFEGVERFGDFYNFIYEYLKSHGGDVCVSGVDERLFSKFRVNANQHRDRMSKLVADRQDISMRILIEAGDKNWPAATYAQYRWQPKKYFSPTPFYVVGNSLALISFTHQTPPYVVLLKSGPFAHTYQQMFNIAWENSAIPERSRS